MIQNIQELASEVAKREGKECEVIIGNVREVLAIISDMIHEDPHVAIILEENGFRRAKEKSIEPK